MLKQSDVTSLYKFSSTLTAPGFSAEVNKPVVLNYMFPVVKPVTAMEQHATIQSFTLKNFQLTYSPLVEAYDLKLLIQGDVKSIKLLPRDKK